MTERMTAVLNSAKEYDAVIITSPVAKRYLTGFECGDAGTLLITAQDAYFIIDARYFEAAERDVSSAKVLLQNKLYDQITQLLGGASKAAVQSEITCRSLEQMRSALVGVTLSPCEAVDKAIERMRTVKTQAEIDNIINAQRIAEKAFSHILNFIREGVTDIEIAAELEYIMRKNGAEGMSFDTIAVSGEETSVPHGVPTGRKVRPGDFITMDYGALLGGCHSDMTRTVAFGFATDEMRAVYDTVLKAQLAALSVLKAGLACSEGDAAARSVIEKAGYGEYFTHSTGHSVGYEIHESPNLSRLSKDSLQAGNVVTVEPGIYIPGRFGVRIEDMALITEGGCIGLTNSEKELIIL